MFELSYISHHDTEVLSLSVAYCDNKSETVSELFSVCI